MSRDSSDQNTQYRSFLVDNVRRGVTRREAFLAECGDNLPPAIRARLLGNVEASRLRVESGLRSLEPSAAASDPAPAPADPDPVAAVPADPVVANRPDPVVPMASPMGFVDPRLSPEIQARINRLWAEITRYQYFMRVIQAENVPNQEHKLRHFQMAINATMQEIMALQAQAGGHQFPPMGAMMPQMPMYMPVPGYAPYPPVAGAQFDQGAVFQILQRMGESIAELRARPRGEGDFNQYRSLVREVIRALTSRGAAPAAQPGWGWGPGGYGYGYGYGPGFGPGHGQAPDGSSPQAQGSGPQAPGGGGGLQGPQPHPWHQPGPFRRRPMTQAEVAQADLAERLNRLLRTSGIGFDHFDKKYDQLIGPKSDLREHDRYSVIEQFQDNVQLLDTILREAREQDLLTREPFKTALERRMEHQALCLAMVPLNRADRRLVNLTLVQLQEAHRDPKAENKTVLKALEDACMNLLRPNAEFNEQSRMDAAGVILNEWSFYRDSGALDKYALAITQLLEGRDVTLPDYACLNDEEPITPKANFESLSKWLRQHQSRLDTPEGLMLNTIMMKRDDVALHNELNTAFMGTGFQLERGRDVWEQLEEMDEAELNQAIEAFQSLFAQYVPWSESTSFHFPDQILTRELAEERVTEQLELFNKFLHAICVQKGISLSMSSSGPLDIFRTLVPKQFEVLCPGKTKTMDELNMRISVTQEDKHSDLKWHINNHPIMTEGSAPAEDRLMAANLYVLYRNFCILSEAMQADLELLSDGLDAVHSDVTSTGVRVLNSTDNDPSRCCRALLA